MMHLITTNDMYMFVIYLVGEFKGAVSEFGKSPSLIELLNKWLVLLFSFTVQLGDTDLLFAE